MSAIYIIYSKCELFYIEIYYSDFEKALYKHRLVNSKLKKQIMSSQNVFNNAEEALDNAICIYSNENINFNF